MMAMAEYDSVRNDIHNNHHIQMAMISLDGSNNDG